MIFEFAKVYAREKNLKNLFPQILLFFFFENIVYRTSEELSLIEAHRVFGDESEDENDKEWVAPNEEGNAFASFDEA